MSPTSAEFLLGGLVGFTTLGAEATNQALRQDGQYGAGDQEGLDTHVNQPREGAGRIVGVEGREDQVTREGSLDGVVGRGLVACLSTRMMSGS